MDQGQGQMNKKQSQQLELPVLSDLNGKVGLVGISNSTPKDYRFDNLFHQPASAEDRTIYNSISDNYFKSLAT